MLATTTVEKERFTLRFRSLCVALAAGVVAVQGGPSPSRAETPEVPAWLQAHLGTGEGQIAPVVLDRARALYLEKLRQGTVRNPCYLAMDATRPSTARGGTPGRRFYVICEAQKSFRAVSSGHGNGRKLRRADFSNDRDCARHFSNAEGSKLTAGGPYVTAETRTSFKGYVGAANRRVPFYRTFLLYDGEGETANARERAIGGHPAVLVRWQCRFRNPESTHADAEGFVPYGRLVNYTGGRSNGCTTWSETASEEILALVEDDPTTLYIYPASGDIDAVAAAVTAGRSLSRAGLYWNDTCLRTIRAPRFWPKETLRPIIDDWRASLPKLAPQELPICK
ncbi:murein L,D-transpeptidase catalytic domain family protein [Rhodovulum visakhapatnamense]|uniref:L,D-transpeptidase-like protein n=1 Tax=Rhodovulum visakhapatnamense TaxID=364297 RepID=A0A4R8FYL1_9RHOB|nr:murein L,D-transpeptidase catalytic domain family protein [Rhodovulum visakhapatnamense]TDX29231.1 hypothetical protein EV657_10952 [Rhodovulum visakhapatnamense]